jgi:hypothetical protein
MKVTKQKLTQIIVGAFADRAPSYSPAFKPATTGVSDALFGLVHPLRRSGSPLNRVQALRLLSVSGELTRSG